MSQEPQLIQLHWQYKDGKTDERAQREIASHDELREFIAEIEKSHPLPEGAVWLFVPESSKHFVMTHAEEENAGN